MDQVAEADLSVTEHVHRLICGDCLAGLPTIDAGSIDVVVTSPPYNFSLTYRGYDDRRREDDCLDWLMRAAYAVHQMTKADASIASPLVAIDLVQMMWLCSTNSDRRRTIRSNGSRRAPDDPEMLRKKDASAFVTR